MTRFLQIEVVECANEPPVIDLIPDTCILAGSNYSQTVTAHDPNSNETSLSASGGPFNLTSGAAVFASTPSNGTVTGVMTWTPPCNSVRNQPYLITIKASDNPTGNETSLVDYESFFIKVVSPPPLNLTVSPVGTSLLLNWNPPAICTQTTGNIIVSYHIYRKEGCHTFTPSPC